jgi:hypothetical protein
MVPPLRRPRTKYCAEEKTACSGRDDNFGATAKTHPHTPRVGHTSTWLKLAGAGFFDRAQLLLIGLKFYSRLALRLQFWP